MIRDYPQQTWDDAARDDCRRLVRLAIDEDLDRWGDWTTAALVPQQAVGRAAVVAREPLIAAGLPAAQLATAELDSRIRWQCHVDDGQPVPAGGVLAEIAGPARGLLTAERLVLNLLGRLSGIATLTRDYVDAVQGTKARIYDTRKTTPGWRRLEKYAVGCGGGRNHRTGLFDAVLIKDNHLALAAKSQLTPADAVRQVRQALQTLAAAASQGPDAGPDKGQFVRRMIVEVEVDTLDQLDQVLPAGPDIVLLDNMSPRDLREAVARRDRVAPGVELEASGGITLQTVRSVADCGVERISVGSLTHGAISRDVGLDWKADA